MDEDFTPEDKYFYLYLLTNPHTNICGCYEIGFKQMAKDTGYNEETVRRLINRLETVHDVIRYKFLRIISKYDKPLLLCSIGIILLDDKPL